MSRTSFKDMIDPIHTALSDHLIETGESKLTNDVMLTKYAFDGDKTFVDIATRVCRGVYDQDHSIMEVNAQDDAFDAMINYLWMPAGRILAGAGTPKRVTLMNCFVTGKIDDSMEGIMQE